MSEPFKRLKAKLEELFQLDRPDLDFGVYRIMHARSAEISSFLENDLLPQVREAFAQHRSADRQSIQKDLQQAVELAQSLGNDPDTTPKVKALRAQLSDAVDVGALEVEVYDHLYNFFRRYYSDGDFLSHRVYREGVYAIPYEGEEVKLHWANADQYYIKSDEYLRDYTFLLRPGDETKPMRVHFKLSDAAEGEHGTVKEATGKERRFAMADADAVSVDGDELVIRFTYQARAEKQKDLNQTTEATVLGLVDPGLAGWLKELTAPHRQAEGNEAAPTRLRVHLDRYTARNTFDYFIHKDLGGFLRRELDFYIKNEVMHLDDVESESVPRVEQYLSKIKVIRRIAGKIIAFLAQLEDFQKRLWLKKKFVTETFWCIRLGCIPEEFYPEIAANDAQREEWVRLFGIDSIAQTLTTPGYSVPLSAEFLKAHPTLVVDTRLLSEGVQAKLLDAVGPVDATTDALLLDGENFHALTLLQARWRDSVSCIYIDPPYNTGGDGFAYKDRYQHSSWATAIRDRVELGRALLHPESGSFFCSIDDGEQGLLRGFLSEVFGQDNFVANVIWQKKYAPANDAKWFSDDHDFLVTFAKARESWRPLKLPRTATQDRAYGNPDNDPRGLWRADNYKSNKTADERPNLYYAITNPTTGEEIWPKENAVWRYTREQHQANARDNRVWWGKDGANAVPAFKRFLSEVGDLVPRTIWRHDEVGHNQDGIRELRNLLPTTTFTSPKPTGLLRRVVRVANGGLTLDFFAGSGTTGHAVIDLNRTDGDRRKFVLVEQGAHFDHVLLPRIEKATFAAEWADGRPKRQNTKEEADRSPRIIKVIRLESYEDTLNNLDLRRTVPQQSLLDAPEAQGADGLREQYLLKYMLDVESRGSQSLLNVAGFLDPRAYRLKVKRPGSDETKEVNVDLLETFNYLIGLTVDHMAAPQTFAAAFTRDDDPDLPTDALRRLLIDGRIQEQPDGPWWFRTVTGTTPDGQKALVIWRNRPGGESPDGVEQDNLVLDAWFQKQRYSAKDSEFDVIWVNGDNNLENLKITDDNETARWKVRLIEEDFHRLMFEMDAD